MQLFLFSHRIRDSNSVYALVFRGRKEYKKKEEQEQGDEQLSLFSFAEHIYRTELIVAIAVLCVQTHLHA